ncbi:hypothetical protein MRX96_055861 [Rhipicephalus microplus]
MAADTASLHLGGEGTRARESAFTQEARSFTFGVGPELAPDSLAKTPRKRALISPLGRSFRGSSRDLRVSPPVREETRPTLCNF